MFLQRRPEITEYERATNFNINSPTFGQISSMNYNPRVIQLSAYYRF